MNASFFCKCRSFGCSRARFLLRRCGSRLSLAVQPSFSTVPYIILDHLVLPMLLCPMFANPQSRGARTEPLSAYPRPRRPDPEQYPGFPLVANHYFQRLTNCLQFAILLRALCFQQLATVKFSNPFALITIQIAGCMGSFFLRTKGMASTRRLSSSQRNSFRHHKLCLLTACDEALRPGGYNVRR